jgi:hypothetical protein
MSKLKMATCKRCAGEGVLYRIPEDDASMAAHLEPLKAVICHTCGGDGRVETCELCKEWKEIVGGTIYGTEFCASGKCPACEQLPAQGQCNATCFPSENAFSKCEIAMQCPCYHVSDEARRDAYNRWLWDTIQQHESHAIQDAKIARRRIATAGRRHASMDSVM